MAELPARVSSAGLPLCNQESCSSSWKTSAHNSQVGQRSWRADPQQHPPATQNGQQMKLYQGRIPQRRQGGGSRRPESLWRRVPLAFLASAVLALGC